jgi:hypothetical protein
MNGLASEPEVWTERYETLRRYVLQGRALLQAQPLGLLVWLSKGMAGWMNEWSKLSQPEPPSSTAVGLPQRGLSTSSWQAELTVLLAQMTLPHLPPRCSL